MAKTELPDIETLDELRAQIILLKVDLKRQEKDLEERWKRLPQEVIRSTVGSVVPIFLNQKIASGTWGFLKGLTGIFSTQKADDGHELTWKEKLLKPVKQAGLFTALKVLYGFIKK